MENKQSFTGSEISNGLLFDLSAERYPCRVHGFDKGEYIASSPKHTSFGYVAEGIAQLEYNDLRIPAKAGMYFSVPGEFTLSGGKGFIIEYFNYVGFFQLGGPVEPSGRLKYIDGCTDSLLVQPIKKGHPCLNALYFPASTFQTQHTHPSYRIGLILDGGGHCLTPQGSIELIPGHVFVIHTDGIHSFATSADLGMNVFSFHPDSDYGPEDENHPMINRTIIEGKSANQMPQIFTK